MGLLIQGGFFMLGPKTNMALLITGWFGIGMGMGFVDGCAPAGDDSSLSVAVVGCGRVIVALRQSLRGRATFSMAAQGSCMAPPACSPLLGHRPLLCILTCWLPWDEAFVLQAYALPVDKGTRSRRSRRSLASSSARS